MNKSLLLIVGTGAVLLLGGVYFVMSSQDTSGDTKKQVSNTTDVTQSQNEVNVQANSEAPTELSYIKTSEGELASIVNDKRVLFFHASWCPTCKTLDKDISSNLLKIPVGVTIAQLDFDKEIDLKKKYGVTLQHTLVQIDSKGNELAKWSGSRDLEDLIARIK